MWSQNGPQVRGRFSPAALPRDRAATGFWVLANGRSASSSFPHQAARVLWCCRRSRLALPAGDLSDSGLSARNVSRRSWVARQHFPRTTTSTIVPIWQFSVAYPAVTLSSVKGDGLGEELRVLLAHLMRGHHTANARRHDPPGPRPVK